MRGQLSLVVLWIVNWEAPRRRMANRRISLPPTGNRSTYDKIHMFDVTLARQGIRESRLLPGDKASSGNALGSESV